MFHFYVLLLLVNKKIVYFCNYHWSCIIVIDELLNKFPISNNTICLWLLYFLHCHKGPIVSMSSNKFGHRPVAMAGGVVCCIGMVATGFVPSLQWLYFTICIEGNFSFYMIKTLYLSLYIFHTLLLFRFAKHDINLCMLGINVAVHICVYSHAYMCTSRKSAILMIFEHQ